MSISYIIFFITVPDVTPTNFAIDESTLNATSAVFTWTGVDENPDIMKGHLVGYDVREIKTVKNSL